jgi:hypothetical protein
VPDTLIAPCPWCLTAGCQRDHVDCSPPMDAAPAPRPGSACCCDRPMPLDDGLCLKCGREVPGHG